YGRPTRPARASCPTSRGMPTPGLGTSSRTPDDRCPDLASTAPARHTLPRRGQPAGEHDQHVERHRQHEDGDDARDDLVALVGLIPLGEPGAEPADADDG